MFTKQIEIGVRRLETFCLQWPYLPAKELNVNEYQNLYRKFLGFAFIAGPLLYFIGTLFMPLGNLGIGGMIAPFGVALLIPVFMEMGRWIGQVQPRFGFTCTVLALLTTAAIRRPCSPGVLANP